MIPTLNIGDFIVVNKYAYGMRLPVSGTRIMEVGEPKRGDIMVFIPPHEPVYYIKRVIGLPGDHVQYLDSTVYINGEALPQTPVGIIRGQGVMHSTEIVGGVTHDIYTAATQRYSRFYDWLPPEGAVIPEGHYFMMGDNRGKSDDSRRWGFVPDHNVVGKAVAVWIHKEPGLNWPTLEYNRWIN
jgi:signal peptidase I